MVSEDTPLLSERNNLPGIYDDVYQRFSPRNKRVIIGMVSSCGLIPFFVTGSFTPSISQIAKDLDTTGTVVNYAVSISWFAASLGGLIAGSYSTFYGRRVIYTFSLPVMVLGSIGVATAPNILGAGVIGDLYKLEERGRAMAIFFATVLVGPSLAPLVGGWVTFYYSWRIMQGFLGIVGFLAFCIMYLLFPETSQPGTRGIDKLRAKYGPDAQERKIRFVFINPLRLMLLLRSPNLLLISMVLSASLMTVFAILVPLVYTIGERYHIANEALIGLCFLPAGLGNMTGAAIVGRISDRTVIYWRRKRGGVWYPEDRLRASLVPLGILVPFTLAVYGLVNKLVDGTLGLTVCLICLFLNGVGVEMAFGPCAAYLVDVMHSRSAEALAANSGLRSILVATGIAFVLPMINHFGIAITNMIFAINVWVAFGLICCVIQYGDRMRSWIDVGFSAIENN